MTHATPTDNTRAVPASHAFDEGALLTWLRAHVAGFEGPLQVNLFSGGQSNPTYKLITPSRTYVMRAKPGPVAKLLPSAHAIEREYRAMHALQGTGVPVAHMLALCEDEAVIGRAFYVMEFVPGRVLWDNRCLAFNLPAPRHLPGNEPGDGQLHTVNPTAVGWATTANRATTSSADWPLEPNTGLHHRPHSRNGRADGLAARPMPSARDESLVSIVRRLPAGQPHVPPHRACVLAVLDWELSTLGHPLADFALPLHVVAHRTRRVPGHCRAGPGCVGHTGRRRLHRSVLPAHRLHHA